MAVLHEGTQTWTDNDREAPDVQIIHYLVTESVSQSVSSKRVYGKTAPDHCYVNITW